MTLGAELFRNLQRELAAGERIRGAVIGIVTGNQDPAKLGRVQVRLPTLSDNDSTWWAPVVSVGAGLNRGWFFIPEIDDEVVVMFEHGDINHPFVVGALWNECDPPADSNGGGNERRTIKSRAGSRLVFDDDQKLLIIEDGGGKGRVTIDANKNLITVEALSGDIGIQAPAGELSAVAKTATFTAKGVVSLASGGAFTMEGGANIEIAGTSSLAITGSTVDLSKGDAKAVQAPKASPKDEADPYKG